MHGIVSIIMLILKMPFQFELQIMTKLLLTLLLTVSLAFQIIAQTSELVPYRVKDEWGFADRKGKIKIKPQYEDVTVFNLGFAAVKMDGKWGAINRVNEFIKNPVYDSIYANFQLYHREFIHSTKGMPTLKVRRNNRIYYLDKLGVEHQANQDPEDDLWIEEIEEEHGKRAIPRSNDEIVYNNLAYSLKNSFHYDEIHVINLVKKDTVQQNDGTDRIFTVKNHGFLVKKDSKYGVIDALDSMVLEMKYLQIEVSTKTGHFWVQEEKGKWYSLNHDGNVVIPPDYQIQGIFHASAETFLVKKDSLLAVIDYNNNFIVPLSDNKIEKRGSFYEIYKNDSVLVYYQDRYIFGGKFDRIQMLIPHKGYRVHKNGKVGFIGWEGLMIVPVRYTGMKFWKNLIIVSYKGMEGVYNREGLLIPSDYYKVVAVYDDLVKVKLPNGKMGYLGKGGKKYYRK